MSGSLATLHLGLGLLGGAWSIFSILAMCVCVKAVQPKYHLARWAHRPPPQKKREREGSRMNSQDQSLWPEAAWVWGPVTQGHGSCHFGILTFNLQRSGPWQASYFEAPACWLLGWLSPQLKSLPSLSTSSGIRWPVTRWAERTWLSDTSRARSVHLHPYAWMSTGAEWCFVGVLLHKLDHTNSCCSATCVCHLPVHLED